MRAHKFDELEASQTFLDIKVYLVAPALCTAVLRAQATDFDWVSMAENCLGKVASQLPYPSKLCHPWHLVIFFASHFPTALEYVCHPSRAGYLGLDYLAD